MGTVAEKLTYLNTTKTLIKDNLNLGGANISNEPFRVYSSKLIDIYKDFLANGTDTLWNNWLPKVNGTGESLTLNNTIKAKMKIDLKGNTSQDSTTGKNILKIKKTINRGITTNVNEDGSLTASGTATETLAYLDTGEKTNLPIGIYTLSLQSALSVNARVFLYNNGTQIGTMTLTAGQTSTSTTTTQVVTDYAVIIYGLTAGSSYNITLKMQLESGSSATSFEPYTNGPSPNPDYPQDIHTVSGDNTIKVCNKNLLNPSEFAQKVIDTPYNSSNISTYDSATGELSIKMGDGSAILDGFKENTQYTIILKYNLTTSGSNLRVEYTDGTKNSLNPDLGTGIFRYVTTSGKTVDKIAHIAYDSTGTKKIYLKESGIFEGVIEATDYEPYQSTTYPINLGSMELCKIGDYQDYIAKSTGKNLAEEKISNANVYSNGRLLTGDYDIYIAKIEQNKAYTVSTNDSQLNVGFFTTKPEIGSTTYDNLRLVQTSKTFTAPITGYIAFRTNSGYQFAMINEGSTALPYEPYGTGQWYLKKNIGKVVLDGSENWALNSSSGDSYRYWLRDNNMKNIFTNIITGNTKNDYYFTRNSFTNYFSPEIFDRTQIGTYSIYNTLSVSWFLLNTNITTIEDFKTWIGTHNVIVYYQYNTPIYTQITDSTLISQLEAIKLSYNEQTNIIQENNDKPFILDVTALGELEGGN